MRTHKSRLLGLALIMVMLSCLKAPVALGSGALGGQGALHPALAAAGGSWAEREVLAAKPHTLEAPAQGFEVLLPLVVHSRSVVFGGAPIWATGGTESSSVALFRSRFDAAASYDEARLRILADTRYEVWLDGEWIGRGPARFSRVRQEFDTIQLGGLSAGSHVVAVLVQYAPNLRRSESLAATLQSSLDGYSASGWQTLTATSSAWKAMLSAAWDPDARLVSQLGLIGPCEVVDLRRLPPDWTLPAFDDSAWPYADELSLSPFPAPSERTIDPLMDVPVPPVAEVESGLLSPGWQLVELEHPSDESAPVTVTLDITATEATTLQIEALEPDPIRVDGGPELVWIPLEDARRPDVLQSQTSLPAGRHRLEVSVPAVRPCVASLPELQGYRDLARQAALAGVMGLDCQLSGGRSLAIRLQNLQIGGSQAPVQSRDPGRRTLLANPIAGGNESPDVQLPGDYAEITVPHGDTPRYVTLDFGRTIHARVSIDAEGPSGTVIDAGWDERLSEGRPLPNPGSLVYNLWSQVDSWVLDGGRRRLTTLDARSGRYLMLLIYGPGPVVLSNVRAFEETYPVEQVGWFSSSDPLLDAVWQTGVDTLIPNMTDALTDTPWRERGMWWADAMIAQDTVRVAFGEASLFRRGLRLMSDAIDEEGRPAALAPNGSGVMILDFGMLWVEGLYDHWQLTDDLPLVEELYPAAQRLLSFLASYLSTSGLLDVPVAHWSQSALIDWPAVTSRSGESTALNAQYSRALQLMAEMARALGHDAEADSFAAQSTAVAQAIQDVLFLPEAGCYAASRLSGELLDPTLHAQSWALRYGVVPDAHRASTSESLVQFMAPFFGESGSPVVEALGMYSVLKALAESGKTSAVLDFIREPYGTMLAQGATTWWELFNPNQDRGHSLSHAWGTSPTWFLSTHVLGARVLGPASWQLAPHPGDLDFAAGAVPLGASVLEATWERPACGQFQLELSSPAETAGSVLLPTLRPDVTALLDGVVVWDQGPVDGTTAELTSEGLLISNLSGGSHSALLSFICFQTYLPWVAR